MTAKYLTNFTAVNIPNEFLGKVIRNKIRAIYKYHNFKRKEKFCFYRSEWEEDEWLLLYNHSNPDIEKDIKEEIHICSHMTQAQLDFYKEQAWKPRTNESI